MPRYDFTSPRLFVSDDLTAGNRIEMDRGQANYLLKVLRLGDGDSVLLFNGRDGEWTATISEKGRKKADLIVTAQARSQPQPFDLHYIFAPLKQARMEYMVQKAVEMGAGVLQPVFTEFTQLRKVNLEKMQAYALEAAEQCGILSLPEIREPMNLTTLLDDWDDTRHLIFCDEGEQSQNPLDTLNSMKKGPLAVLIGPEGGFSEAERTMLREKSAVTPIPLGPRVLRADTAAVAALALVQAKLGDWHD